MGAPPGPKLAGLFTPPEAEAGLDRAYAGSKAPTSVETLQSMGRRLLEEAPSASVMLLTIIIKNRPLYKNGFTADVIEKQLAHGERNKVRAAYNHAQYLPERRKMMQWWSSYLDALAKKPISDA